MREFEKKRRAGVHARSGDQGNGRYIGHCAERRYGMQHISQPMWRVVARIAEARHRWKP
jgi:hypothetical protein